MKAAVCREFGKPLVIEEVEIDPPREGEVMVRLSACAICHSDILYMEGAWGGVRENYRRYSVMRRPSQSWLSKADYRISDAID